MITRTPHLNFFENIQIQLFPKTTFPLNELEQQNYTQIRRIYTFPDGDELIDEVTGTVVGAFGDTV